METTLTFANRLCRIHACTEAVRWVGDKTLREAWEQCERADWMLWYCAKVLPLQRAMLAGCACARTALKCVPAGEERPLRAIEAAERWASGDLGVSLDDVLNAASASAEAAYAAYDAASAASASADVAYAAFDAAYAATNVASAASAAAAATGASAASAAASAAAAAAPYSANAQKTVLKEMCAIVRSIISIEELEAAWTQL